MYGKLVKISGDTIQIKLADDIDFSKIQKFANGKQPIVEVKINDGRLISPSQRSKIFALINDFCYYTGYSVDEAECLFKGLTKTKYGIDDFSLSDCSMTTGCLMIEALLEFMFEHDIPFATKTWDSIPSFFPKQMLCVKHRKCVICGKHADIAHVDTVGMGRNRNKINHVGLYIMALCREHHTMQETIGLDTFMELFHIKPIKVTPEVAKELHLGKIDITE